MSTEQVHQAYMPWRLAVGSYEYARQQGNPHAVHQAEQVMLDRYETYLRLRAQWEQGVPA
jgi:hypothetical protein